MCTSEISVREFAEEVFAGLDLDWQEHVKFDARYLRPTEVALLKGDATKAHKMLGWKPKVMMPELCRMMVESDLKLARQERALRDAGHVMTQPVSRLLAQPDRPIESAIIAP